MTTVPRHGEIKFEYYPDQPPTTKVGEWRCRLGSGHFGTGPTIEEALHDLAKDIERERDAVERARISIRDKKIKT